MEFLGNNQWIIYVVSSAVAIFAWFYNNEKALIKAGAAGKFCGKIINSFLLKYLGKKISIVVEESFVFPIVGVVAKFFADLIFEMSLDNNGKKNGKEKTS